jgi:integrase
MIASGIKRAGTRRRGGHWKHANLDGLGLHECRHTYAAYMIAAGVNAKALSTNMGNSSAPRVF